LDPLDGDALLHTDFNPLNILLGPDRTWIIDWAWPTRGAVFIDAACFLIRAMAAGWPGSWPFAGERTPYWLGRTRGTGRSHDRDPNGSGARLP
jgi:hypothetical protein